MPLGASNLGGGGGAASANAIKAGEAFVEITGRDKLSGILGGIGKKLHGFGSMMQKMGVGSIAIGAGILTPLLAIFKESVDYGSGLKDTADRMNTTVEAVQRLAKAAEMSDSSLESMQKANTLLTKAAVAASNGVEKQTKAFLQLGYSAEDFLAFEADDRILAVAEAFDEMNDPLQQSEFLFSLLGKSAVELLPLFKSGANEIRGFYEAANKFAISQGEAEKAEALGDSIDSAWKAAKLTVLELGFALVGLNGEIEGSISGLTDMLVNLRALIRDNQNTVIIVAGLGVALITLGGAFVTAGTAISAFIVTISALLSIASAVVGAAFTPWGIAIIAVVGALILCISTVTDFNTVLMGTKENVAELGKELYDNFAASLQGIANALKQGKVELAWKIMLASLKLAWMQFKYFLQKEAVKVAENVEDGWRNWVTGTGRALLKGSNWMTEQFAFTDKAKDDIIKANADTEKALIDQFYEGVKDRRKVNEGQFAGTLKGIEEQKKALQSLIEEANKVPPIAGGPEAAPMPRGAESTSIGRAIATLGDAVKGTFGSRDYRGSLGIGPQSDTAKEELKETKKIRGLLEKIHGKIDVPMFD